MISRVYNLTMQFFSCFNDPSINAATDFNSYNNISVQCVEVFESKEVNFLNSNIHDKIGIDQDLLYMENVEYIDGIFRFENV